MRTAGKKTMKFEKLNIIAPILKALKEKGYQEASPIQEKAIPLALQQRDILGCAQTGTGKTAAFAIPTIQLLEKKQSNKIRALILTPTRELASQILASYEAYGKYVSLKSTVIFGGVSQRPQEKSIRNGVDILIATPGRLNDLIKQKIVDLSHVEIFILDEADRMLDMGFLNDVKKIIKTMPNQKQTLLFSATMPKEIKELTTTLLKDPAYIEVTPESSTVDKITQSLYYVDKVNKRKLLIDLLTNKGIATALVFTRTKATANRVVKYLAAANINANAIHGNKSQNARQLALDNFKSGKISVLVATDIAARGIDINELSHVINYDLPNEAEAYVHRIGRTGRAGSSGVSISFCDIDEVPYAKDIERLIRKKIPVVMEHDFPMLVKTPTPKKKGKTGKPAQRKEAPKQAKTKSAPKNADKKSKRRNGNESNKAPHKNNEGSNYKAKKRKSKSYHKISNRHSYK